MLRRVHPLTVIFYALVVFLMCITFNHPLYITVIFIFLAMSTLILGHKNELIHALLYSLYGAVFILIVNCVASGYGETIIYRYSLAPFFGEIVFTAESLFFSINMAIKFACVFIIFIFYSIVIDRDETFSFILKYMPNTAITISLTLNALHRLRIDIPRIKNVMESRGTNFNQRNIVKKIKAYYPLLKIVLISSLEGGLTTGEAVYSRRYGTNKRTSYTQMRMRLADYLVNSLNMLLLFMFVYGIRHGAANYSFYPYTQVLTRDDLAFAAGLSFNLLFILIALLTIQKAHLFKHSN